MVVINYVYTFDKLIILKYKKIAIIVKSYNSFSEEYIAIFILNLFEYNYTKVLN